MFDTLPLILILLISSVFAVALFRRLRLPAMLAYFLVGLALGPHTFGLLPDSGTNREFAEFGIVFLMFSIGLEFSLPQLYAMRKKVLGLGGGQVMITLLITMLIAKFSGLSWATAFVIGAAIAMSSTAIVSKILAERIDLNSRHGRLSIGVLLFQDIAVVPMLVLIPALGSANSNLLDILGLAMLKASVMLLLLFTIGKWLINPWFNLVASQRSRELFVMNVLMVTLLLAYATKMAGLSYALGAFIAGMLISETKFRYQVESDISPFRDILLGLFFISVGMLLNLQQIYSNMQLVLLVLFGFILLKALVVGIVVRLFKYEAGVAIRTALILAQAGEFSFVILALGAEHHLINGQALQAVLAASLLSMVIAPFLIQYNGRIARRLVGSYTRNSGKVVEEIEHAGQNLENHVIICGYGRSGHNLVDLLTLENIPYVAMDSDPDKVQRGRDEGHHVELGDATRFASLMSAGLVRASAVVVTYPETPSALKVLAWVKEHAPHVPVVVRTHDDKDLEVLRSAGAAEVVPEVIEGSLMLASQTLAHIGIPLKRVIRPVQGPRMTRYALMRDALKHKEGLGDIESH